MAIGGAALATEFCCIQIVLEPQDPGVIFTGKSVLIQHWIAEGH